MRCGSLSNPSRFGFRRTRVPGRRARGVGRWLGCGMVLVLSSACPGQHVGDILLQNDGGRIETGGIVTGPSGPGFVAGLRVFRAAFGEFPNFTDDPGFDTTGVPGGGFADGTLFAFDFVDALRKWDGADFDAVPAETIRVAKGSASVLTPTGVNEFREGFVFGQVALGFLHEHVRFTLQPPQSAGVYAMQLRLRVTTGGVRESLPFWIVFNQNASVEEHGAAVAYLENLVNPACAGDITNDGAVNTADLTRFLGAFGNGVLRYSNGDFNGDAMVNTSDLTFLLGRFGGGCS